MPSHADSALDGATIRIIIAHKAGNTTDTMARLFAKTLEKYLPDSSINVQNLDGNGGSLAMAEIHDAKASLVTVGFVNSSVVFSQVTQGDALPYDIKDFHWIGALASSQRVLVVRKDALDRADPSKSNAAAKPMVSLAMSASAQNYIDGLLLNGMTNLRLKMVPGFKTDQQNAMLLAGDADAGIGTYENFREFIEAGDLVPVLKFGTVGYPDALATLPTLEQVALPTAPRDVIALATQLSDMGRFVVAAPATPDAQQEALVQGVRPGRGRSRLPRWPQGGELHRHAGQRRDRHHVHRRPARQHQGAGRSQGHDRLRAADQRRQPALLR